MQNKKVDFLLRAVEELTEDKSHPRYFEFPRTASSRGGFGFPDGMRVFFRGVSVIISGIGMSDIINKQFSIRFFVGQTIKFKCEFDTQEITFKSDYDGKVAERVFGEKVPADYVVWVAIRGLKMCLDKKYEKICKLCEEASEFVAR